MEAVRARAVADRLGADESRLTRDAALRLEMYTESRKEFPGMGERAFSLTAGIVFLLIALAHLVRIFSAAPFVIEGVSIPLWASGIAVLIMGYLSYEGFHFARKPPKG